MVSVKGPVFLAMAYQAYHFFSFFSCIRFFLCGTDHCPFPLESKGDERKGNNRKMLQKEREGKNRKGKGREGKGEVKETKHRTGRERP